MSFYRDFNDKLAIEAWNSVRREPYHTIEVRQLSPTVGAEIGGVDLSQELPEEQFAEIRRALDENLAIVFRDQDISKDDHKRFARRFGKSLHRHELAASRFRHDGPFDPEFLSWKTDRSSRFTAGDGWHPDVSCDPSPIAVSLLRVTRTPPLGGDTAFANMYLAYEFLSDPIKQLLDGLTAVHDGSLAWTAGYGAKPDPGKTYPQSEHPVVVTHPRTGRKFLYVNAKGSVQWCGQQRDYSFRLQDMSLEELRRNDRHKPCEEGCCLGCVRLVSHSLGEPFKSLRASLAIAAADFAGGSRTSRDQAAPRTPS